MPRKDGELPCQIGSHVTSARFFSCNILHSTFKNVSREIARQEPDSFAYVLRRRFAGLRFGRSLSGQRPVVLASDVAFGGLESRVG